MVLKWYVTNWAVVWLMVLSNTAMATQYKTLNWSGASVGNVGGTLNLSLGDPPKSFNYYAAIDSNVNILSAQLFDALVEFNPQNYKIEPALAQSWNISPDGKVYTFKLRQMNWSDGVALSSADVAFSFKKLLLNPDLSANDLNTFTFDGQVIQVSTPDPLTVKLSVPKAVPALLQLLRTVYILPKHRLENSTDFNNAWNINTPSAQIVGTGPFVLAQYSAGQSVLLKRNPYYWKKDRNGTILPYLDQLQYQIIREPQAQQAQFQAGNLDVLNITGTQYPDLKAGELAGKPWKTAISLTAFGGTPHLSFNFNAQNPKLAKLFSSLKFRQAMENSVNRNRIIDVVYNGLASSPGHGVSPKSFFYYDTRKYLRPFDLKTANKLLDSLGLTDRDGDGIRNFPKGENIRFSLTYASDTLTWPLIANILYNDWQAIGIQVDLKPALLNTLISVGTSGKFEALLLSFGDQPDPDLRRAIWQPGNDLYYWHRNGRLPWEKHLYDILDKASVANNINTRRALYNQWQLLMAQQLPVIMLVKPSNVAVYHKDLQNYLYTNGVIPGYNPIPLWYLKK